MRSVKYQGYTYTDAWCGCGARVLIDDSGRLAINGDLTPHSCTPRRREGLRKAAVDALDHGLLREPKSLGDALVEMAEALAQEAAQEAAEDMRERAARACEELEATANTGDREVDAVYEDAHKKAVEWCAMTIRSLKV